MAIKRVFAGIDVSLPGGDMWTSEYTHKALFHSTMEKLLWPERYEWMPIINPLYMTQTRLLIRKKTAPDVF